MLYYVDEIKYDRYDSEERILKINSNSLVECVIKVIKNGLYVASDYIEEKLKERFNEDINKITNEQIKELLDELDDEGESVILEIKDENGNCLYEREF